MKNFAIRRQRQGASLIYGLANFIAADFARPRAKGDAAMAVHATDVRSRHPDQRMLDRNAGHIFRMFYRFLNTADRFVEFRDDPFAQPSRFADAVAAIT